MVPGVRSDCQRTEACLPSMTPPRREQPGVVPLLASAGAGQSARTPQERETSKVVWTRGVVRTRPRFGAERAVSRPPGRRVAAAGHAVVAPDPFEKRHLVTQAVPFDEWPQVAVASIVAADDRTLSPDWIRRTSLRVLRREAIQVHAGHCPRISRPAEIAQVLDRRAGGEPFLPVNDRSSP